MTVDDWLTILETEEALPDSNQVWEYLGPQAPQLWGLFNDWLLDQGKADLVSLTEIVRNPFRDDRGWGHNRLRPFTYGPITCWEFRPNEGWDWLEDHGSCVPPFLFPAGMVTFSTRLECWRDLYDRVARWGFNRPGKAGEVNDEPYQRSIT